MRVILTLCCRAHRVIAGKPVPPSVAYLRRCAGEEGPIPIDVDRATTADLVAALERVSFVLLSDAAASVQAAGGSIEAFNDAGPELVAGARAHATAYMARAFAASGATVRSGAAASGPPVSATTATVLERLCRLFCTSQLIAALGSVPGTWLCSTALVAAVAHQSAGCYAQAVSVLLMRKASALRKPPW